MASQQHLEDQGSAQDILQLQLRIARVYAAANHAAQARDLVQSHIAHSEQVFGATHPATIEGRQLLNQVMQ